MQYKRASYIKPEYGDWCLQIGCQLCWDSKTLAFPST